MHISSEFADAFQRLDGMINTFDAEGAGPLRKGEQPFSWPLVAELAHPLADLGPDLRVGIWLLRAGLACDGVPGLAGGLARLAAWVELPPNQLHPLAEADEHPRALHRPLLRWLGSPSFLNAVRDTPALPASAHSLGALPQASDLDTAHDPLAQALALAAASVDRINAVLANDPETADVTLTGLADLLADALRRFHPSTPPLGTGTAQPHPFIATDRKTAIPGHATAIHSREDARAALARVAGYFEHHEPGHPAPILLRRIQLMLGASFEDLLHELFPDADSLLARLRRPAPN